MIWFFAALVDIIICGFRRRKLNSRLYICAPAGIMAAEYRKVP